jgi:energy-coupling factor transporter ATP-binding protein EcfA2
LNEVRNFRQHDTSLRIHHSSLRIPPIFAPSQYTTILTNYTSLRSTYADTYAKCNRQYNTISVIRLATGLLCFVAVYFWIATSGVFPGVAAFSAAVIFLILVKKHNAIGWQRTLAKELVALNDDELAYLQKRILPFADGAEWNDPTHAYANDLDIFGKSSLFQHLNRTATHRGKATLAAMLLRKLPSEEILQNQEAVAELAQKTGWRQRFFALAKIANDHPGAYDGLVRWGREQPKKLSLLWVVAAYALPIALLGCFVVFWASHDERFFRMAGILFTVNLVLVFSQLSRIKEAIVEADKPKQYVKLYSLMLAEIEGESFQSPRLNAIKDRLCYPTGTASAQVQQLSVLLDRMDSISNGFGAILFNGALQYHVHVLRQLMRWKGTYADEMPVWLDAIAEFEALNSLGNFLDNNPDFIFPTVQAAPTPVFEGLGHPLLAAEKRVVNDVAFDAHRFIILTGSNMSGKSTFLRTLGINMVLAGIGAPVCATNARFHPLPVLVSMRLSDSLSDSESYFFAEVKRLHQIMQTAGSETCFVLLDEILRGTNSDDKRSGTVGIIQKIVAQQSIGAIATHDLEVCTTAAQYPDTLINKCFEVDIVNDELAFDYRLRDGICRNKSATFLMKKMGIV